MSSLESKPPESGRMPKKLFRRITNALCPFYPLLLAILGIVFVVLIACKIYGGAELDHASGSWATLALDLAEHNLLYRPPLCELGYGGTRHFPLHFLLHGLLIKAGMAPLPSGRLITLASFLLYGLIVAAVLKAKGASWWLILTVVLAAGVTSGFVHSLATVRGDLLACTLSLGGLAVFLTAESRQRWTAASMFAGGGLFLLAFATKFTILYGPAAVLLYFLFNRRWKQALFFALFMLAGVLLLLLLFNYISGGAFATMLGSTFLGGSDTKVEPATFSQRLLVFGWFFFNIGTDPATLLIIAAAIVLLIVNRKRLSGSLILITFIVVAVETFVMFQFPGVWINHLLDLVSVSLISIAGLTIGGRRVKQVLTVFLLAYIGFAGSTLAGALTDNCFQQRRELMSLLQEVKRADNVLSENPWYPILAGKEPLMMDAYMFRILAQKNPKVRRHMMDRIGRREFDLILLVKKLTYSHYFLSGGNTWYEVIQFGPNFSELLQANYRLSATIFNVHLWKPIK